MSNEKQTILTTSDVTIKTLTVEVQVLKIGNRQVTLSVFRQLPEEDIINKKTGMLQGIPWGRVNYHPDGCEYSSTHLHVVWQKGKELRRSGVNKPGDYSYYWNVLIQRYADNYILARLCEERDVESASFIVNCEDREIKVTFDYDVARFEQNERRGQFGRLKHKGALLGLLIDRNMPVNSEDIFENYLRPSVHGLRKYLPVARQSYTELEALDQLFIAV